MAQKAKALALKERVKSKLAELDDDRDERDQARRKVHRIDLRIEEIQGELRKARRRVRRREAILDELRADLDALDAVAPEEDTPEEQELRARLDGLAGEYEEAVAVRDRLLDRLDQLKEKQAEAQRALDAAVAESADDKAALERMRERRSRIRERRKQREGRPSEHFDYNEFDCNDGTPLPKQSEAAVKDWCQRIGEPLRAQFGSVHVNSGFRHRAYNAQVGGEDESMHIYDFPGRDFKTVAVDVTCERGTPGEWYEFTAGKADGRGRYSTFHHADTRNRIGMPDAVW